MASFGALPPDDRATLQKMRRNIADQGIELTPDQLIKSIVEIKTKIARDLNSSGFDGDDAEMGLMDMVRYHSIHKGVALVDHAVFDDEKEMLEYVRRAKLQYETEFRIKTEGRLFHVYIVGVSDGF